MMTILMMIMGMIKHNTYKTKYTVYILSAHV